MDGRTDGPAITWPGRARIVVVAIFNFDVEYLCMSRAALKSTTIGFTDYSRGQHGPRGGPKRCLDTLSTHDIKSTFFAPGTAAEKYIAQVESIHVRGHEIACHGYMHESVRDTLVEEETEILEKGEVILERTTGWCSVGYRGLKSTIYPLTPELLAQRGYLYSFSMKSCDWAYLWEKDGQALPLVELPCDITMNDLIYFYLILSDPIMRSIYTNREVFENRKDEFDGLVKERDKILTPKLHSQMTGHASQITVLGNFIAYMKRHGAWITICEETTRHVLVQAEANQENPEKGGAAL